jgi:hypothetical protein
MNREQLLKMISEITLSEKPEEQKNDDVPVVLIPDSFGCQRSGVECLVRDILKSLGREDIKVILETSRPVFPFSPGTLVTITTDSYGDYWEGESYLVYDVDEDGDAYGMDFRGNKKGEVLLNPKKFPSSLRKATEEEIKTWVENYSGPPVMIVA